MGATARYTFPVAAALLLAIMAAMLLTSDVFAQNARPGQPTGLSATAEDHDTVTLA